MEIWPEVEISLTKVLFYGSMALPYLLVLLVPRTTTIDPLVSDFFALLTLIVTSLVLAVRVVRRQRSGWGLLYPVSGLAAVVLFFVEWDNLQRVGDYLDFCCRKPQLEAHLTLLNHHPTPADTIRVGMSAYCNFAQGGACYDVQPPGILLITTGGAASDRFWGYAYSPTNAKPHFMGRKLSEWSWVTGHWYRWQRPD